ncbi:MAG: protein kinase [Sandaracinaceae bacterium]|nr:protein kinase [Sandaracinaceae bacterium]
MSTLRADLLPQEGDLIAEHYRIEKLLGHGGMGAVFAAKHERTGRAVAIKWMLPQAATSAEAVARFIAEARATARIEHPNVVHIYDFGEANGSPFLVMERLRGCSLREHLDTVGRLTPAEAIHLLVPVMRGLVEAHREGIIHRDIKPDNIFLCRGKDGAPREAKVVDFGISKLYDDDKMSNLTGTGMMMGTPAYMCPEQLNAPKDADPRFDVYAFGVVLYEALTGRPPYEADGIFQLVAEIMKADVVPPSRRCPDIPPALDSIVLRAMHKDPAYRFGSMAEMIEAFEAVRPQLGLGAAPGLFHAPSSPYGATMAVGTGPVPGQPTPSAPFPVTHATPAPYGHTPAPHTPPPHTPPHAMYSTAVLPPTQGGYGSQPGYPASTPHTPYGTPAPMPTPIKSGGGLGKVVALGGVALLLGGVAAAGVAIFLFTRADDALVESDVAPPPLVVAGPGPAVEDPPAVPPSTVVEPTTAEAEPVVVAAAASDEPDEPIGADPAEVEPAADPGAEPAAGTPAGAVAAADPGRPSRPRVEPPRPVVRSMGGRGPVVQPVQPAQPVQPIVRPAPVVTTQPRSGQRGANGALIIE